MNKPSQSGSAHVIIIICLVLALLTALGWVFYQNFIAKEPSKTNTELVVVEKNDTDDQTEQPAKPTADPYTVPTEADLIAAYEDTVGDDFKVFDIEAKRSKTEGYMIVYAGAGDSVGSAPVSFYRTPDKKWHLTEEFRQTLSCPSKNSTDVRKAYLGELCYDQAEKETVVK